jgi:hypothetical protein
MAHVTFQTIKLARGKHGSPAEGACVMELASMLAGEPFSDHPTSVCPVIGSFLRAYNDSIDDERRQDLYAYASEVVGSNASPAVQHARVRRLTSWSLEIQQRRWTRLFMPQRLRSLAAISIADGIGTQSVRAISKHTDETHARAMALIDELLAITAAECYEGSAACPEVKRDESRLVVTSASTDPSTAPASTSPG